MIRLMIDPNKRYQQIDNFSASGAWSIDPIGAEWSEESKNKLADLLFSQEKGIGLSAWRFNFGSGSVATDADIMKSSLRYRGSETFREREDAPYDWSRHAGQQWFVQAARKRGVEQFIAMVYSPPVWMTKNGHGQPDPEVGSTNLKDGYEGAFARYMADIIRHFRDEKGVHFRWISPINEPSWAWNRSNQEGNRYNNEDIKRVVDALYDELQRQNPDTAIDAPDAAHIGYLLDDALYREASGESGAYQGNSNEALYGGKYREFIKDFLGDGEYRSKIGNKICGHSYWTDDDQLLVKSRQLLRKNIDNYSPGAVYWQTEYCVLGDRGPGRDLGIDTALDAAKVIHADLTYAHASAWHWWLSLSPHDYKDGLIYTDYQKPGDAETIFPSKILWALGNYSRFVRPGFRRIDINASSAHDALLPTAFLDEKTGRMAIVLVHTGDEDIEVRLDGADGFGLPAQLTPYVTSGGEEDDLRPKAPVATSAAVPIPRKSIVTLVTACPACGTAGGNGTD